MGNEILLMDGVKYEEWPPPDEAALARIVEEHAQDIFGEDCLYFGDLKKRIKSSAGAGSIPDGWAVNLGVPIQAYPVEIELAAHDVYGHISPQIDKTRAGLQNPVTQQQVTGALYGEINKDTILNAKAKSKIGSHDLHKLMSDAISKQPQELLIVIDSASPQLRECAANKSVPPKIVEFATFCREGQAELMKGLKAVHIHQFEPLFVESKQERTPPGVSTDVPATQPDRSPTVDDPIVVPAQEEGFQNTFLAEDRWYAIRVDTDRIPHLKYIAAYQVAPVSAITHWASIRSIEPWPEEPGKFVVNFGGKARQIGPIARVPGGEVKTFQGPRYTSLERLLKAKNLDESFA